MLRIAPMLFFVTALLVAGCGSDEKAATTTSTLKLMPDARTSAEWAQRAVARFLRPLNKDLQTLNNLNTTAVRLYVASGQKVTLRILNTRMADLKRCGDRLVVIGPPPQNDPELQGVHDDFRRACDSYEVVADKVIEALPLLSSGRSDVIERGNSVLAEANAPSRRAAKLFQRAIRIAQKRPEFRAAGLKPTPLPSP